MRWKSILKREMTLHPRMEEPDALKLFFQALRGGDHLLSEPDRFRECLALEWDELPLSTDSMLPLIQPISPSGLSARLHLATARCRGISLLCVESFLVSSGLCNTPEHAVESALPGFIDAAAELGFERSALERGFQGVPRHSSNYGFAAYRVFRL